VSQTAELRVELAFEGGQALRVRLAPAALERLRAALAGGAGWAAVEQDGERLDINLGRLVYLREASLRPPGFRAPE
jgi:hypothetical protein